MLTPEEIQAREFLVSLRGYDRDEVHAFLGRVAEQLAQTEAKASQLQQRLDRLKQQQPASAAAAEPAPAAAQTASPEPSAMFAEIGKETQRILEAAQEAGQQIQRKARQEADRDLQGARGQAAKLIAEGERRREHIERIVSELEQSRAAMSLQLRGIGRTIEQTLRELTPEESSSTVREALGADAAADAAATKESAAESATPTSAPAAEKPAAEKPAPAPAKPAATAPAAAEQAAPSDTASDVDTQAPEPAAPAPAASDANAAPAAAAPVIGPDDAATDQSPAAAPAVSSATEPAMPPARDEATDADAKDPQGLRASALSPLHPKLVRKVKRELQEVQNIALDKVRRAKGQGDVDSFLPDDEDTSGLGEGAGDLLVQAWQAGVASGGVLAKRDLGDAGEHPDLAGDFLRDASDRVRAGLSSTLRMGMSSQETPQALSDRIGAVFAEFKGAQAEELAATHLIRAYEQGLLSAWTAGGIPARKWVMGREPRCPEARCRSNDQSGTVAVGESFPSGHDVPPVHVGCTCTTVPAEESTA